MKFIYVFDKKAQLEYEDSIFWYSKRSIKAAKNFVLEVENTINLIIRNPLIWKNSYKNFRELGLRNFPFIIIYFIDFDRNRIIISSVFHTSRNPKMKYKLSNK